MRKALVRTRRYSLTMLVLAALAADSQRLPGLTQSGNARIVRQVAIGQVGTHKVLAALIESEAGFELGIGLLEEEGLFFFTHATEPRDVIVDNTPNSPPDGASVFVLGADFTLSEYPLVVGANGLLRVGGPIIYGPFGDPIGVASLVRVSQLENHPGKENDQTFAIGTDLGRLTLINGGRRVEHLDLGGPIADLVAIPQVGRWVFVALVQSDMGQRLIGIQPPPDDSTPARIVFDLQPLNPVGPPIVNLAASPPPDDSLPLGEPRPVRLVAVTNTRFVHRLTIPASPTIGGRSTSPLSRVHT